MSLFLKKKKKNHKLHVVASNGKGGNIRSGQCTDYAPVPEPGSCCMQAGFHIAHLLHLGTG